MAIYKARWSRLATTENKSSERQGGGLNLGPPDYKSIALPVGHGRLQYYTMSYISRAAKNSYPTLHQKSNGPPLTNALTIRPPRNPARKKINLRSLCNKEGSQLSCLKVFF